MTISGYSNAIVDVMLGWLKGLANWVLRLFNLAGSVSASPLLWLSQNWLKLLIFFLALGLILDRLVWLIRWRPYWVWFRKDRVIVNDARFFAKADMDKAADWEGDLQDNWDEHDYVVASTVVKSQTPGKSRGAVVRDGKRPAKPEPMRRRTEGMKVERRVPRENAPSVRRRQSVQAQADGANRRGVQRRRPDKVRRPVPDNMFAVDAEKLDASDFYEDEVFNVSNLPALDEYDGDGKK